MALAGCGVSVGVMRFAREYAAHVPASGLHRLVLISDNGDVTAIAGNVTAIEIHARIETHDFSELNLDSVSVTRSKGTATITSVCRHASIVFWRVQNCGVDYAITYPRSMQLSVTVVNGDVIADDARAPVNVRTTNGDVTIRAAENDVVAQSREGDVTVALAQGWKGNRVDMKTMFGDVRFRVPDDFRGGVRAHTIFGEIDGLTAYAPRAQPPIADLSTSFGDVDIIRT